MRITTCDSPKCTTVSEPSPNHVFPPNWTTLSLSIPGWGAARRYDICPSCAEKFGLGRKPAPLDTKDQLWELFEEIVSESVEEHLEGRES
jgi:hypothetical protein